MTQAQAEEIKDGLDTQKGLVQINYEAEYIAQQEDKTPDNTVKKALATKLAVNELKLNHWTSTDADYELVYKTVFIEKLMFVEMSYNISEIYGMAQELLSGQKQMVATLGLIVSNQGEILRNQRIIITKVDEIKVVVDHIEEISEEILINTETIITNTEEILENQERFEKNGIPISNRVAGSSNGGGGAVAANNNTLLYVGIGAATLIVLVIVIKVFKK